MIRIFTRNGLWLHDRAKRREWIRWAYEQEGAKAPEIAPELAVRSAIAFADAFGVFAALGRDTRKITFTAKVDSVEIEGDEDGFHLIVETDEGTRLNLHIHHVAEDLYDEVKKGIGPWLADRDAAYAWRPTRITQDDLDAYPPGDPKRIGLEREADRQGGL